MAVAEALAERSTTGYVTGHCASGACYGSKKQAPSGARFQACQWKYEYRGKLIVCTHECHSQFEEMLAMMAEMNGGDASALGLLGPTGEPLTAVTRIDDTPRGVPLSLRPLDLETTKTFAPTPSGRAARGELEENVRAVIAAHFEVFDHLTPQIIGVLINKETPPSEGAIHSVLMRWEAKGLATVERKPFRFGTFTTAGLKYLVGR